jgi:hypothetical protein
MYSLEQMSLADMAQASARLRKLGHGASSMEEVAQRVVRFIFDEFGSPETGDRGAVLVRLYKTHALGELPSDLRAFARSASQAPLDDAVPCLVLLGTVGVEEDWAAPARSRGHRAIPLPSVDAVARLPMVAQLVSQLGFDVAALVGGIRETLVDRDERTFNVFHVPNAVGSPYIPAQDFVERYGVRSVLGCGGQLPDGQIYAIIVFSRVRVTRETADVWKPLALSTKLALLPFLTRTFDGGDVESRRV